MNFPFHLMSRYLMVLLWCTFCLQLASPLSMIADSVFIPHIMKNLDCSKQVDVVWDTYIARSVKKSVRDKRGKGI